MRRKMSCVTYYSIYNIFSLFIIKLLNNSNYLIIYFLDYKGIYNLLHDS